MSHHQHKRQEALGVEIRRTRAINEVRRPSEEVADHQDVALCPTDAIMIQFGLNVEQEEGRPRKRADEADEEEVDESDGGERGEARGCSRVEIIGRGRWRVRNRGRECRRIGKDEEDDDVEEWDGGVEGEAAWGWKLGWRGCRVVR